jgi:hypothetical protein
MTNETPVPPEFSADFALRVLQEADRVMAHRQRAWRAFAAGAAVVSLAFGAALGLRTLDKGPPPTAVADARSPDAVNQADALDDLFPDAAPVARLDRTYLSGGANDLLAEDTADEDGGF